MVVAGLHAQRRRELIQSSSEEGRNIMAENRGSPPGYFILHHCWRDHVEGVRVSSNEGSRRGNKRFHGGVGVGGLGRKGRSIRVFSRKRGCERRRRRSRRGGRGRHEEEGERRRVRGVEDDVLENDKSYHNGDNKGWVMCGAKWDDPDLSLRYLLPEFSVTAPPLVSGHYRPSYDIVVLFGST